MVACALTVRKIFRNALRIVIDPAGFFRAMPQGGGSAEPLFFLLVMAAGSGVAGGLAQAVIRLSGLEVYAGLAMGLVSFVLLPLLVIPGALVAGFFVAALCHLLWKLMGSRVPYRTSCRCIAYLSALGPVVALLSAIPLVGGAAGIVLVIRHLCIVSSTVHGVALRRACAVFGVLGVFCVVLSISSRYAAWRIVRDMEQAARSWQGASEQMERSAQEMRRLMDKELLRQQGAVPEP